MPVSRHLADILSDFTAAVEAGDGARFAALFTEDGVYDDVFYGVFQGREAIANMLEGLFHRDGRNFKWEMIDPVDDGRTGYARWRFSFDSTLEHIKDKRIFMDGVGLFELRDGLISRYEDCARTAELLEQMGMPEAKQQRVVARMQAKMFDEQDWSAHGR
jgi:ketosteroid isomerase-like protein